MAACYSPVEGVELILFGAGGALHIGKRRWPVRKVDPLFTKHGLDRGWMVEIPFENGALVLVVANDLVPDYMLDAVDYPALFSVSLHHQFDWDRRDGYIPARPVDTDEFEYPCRDDLPLAGIRGCMLDLHPGIGDWQLHEDPEPDWLNWWLWRIGGLESPAVRRPVP